MALSEAAREKLDSTTRSYIEKLERAENRWQRKYQTLEQRYEVLEERHRLLLFKRFARSSEQEPAGQQQLFAEAEETVEAPEATEEQETTVTVAAHERKKGGRKGIDERHPRIEVVHDISEKEKQCACGDELMRIGEETREIVQVIPEQMWVERHVYPKYGCHACEGSGDEDRPAVRIAPREATILPRSIASPALIAFILVNKFVDHLPFYRQEKRFGRIGIEISRQDMSNWTITVAQAIKPLIERFVALIRGGPFVQMDETELQVLKEPDRANTAKSYMWLARGGPPEASVLVYHYSRTRNSEYPRTLLEDYEGYVQADAYRVYRMLAEALGFILVGCWAHARRKFFEAGKATKKAGAAEIALKYIGRLYQAERELRAKDLDPKKFVEQRRAKVEPILAEFRAWLDEKKKTVVPSTLLGKAVEYTLAEWDALSRYLDRPQITPDNNAAENAIRPFVLGRNYAERRIMLSHGTETSHLSAA
jgi:transposase